MSINDAFIKVQNFQKTFGQPVANKPTLMNLNRATSRAKWMHEEIDEFIEATKNGDLYEQVDAMIDEIYFSLGTLVELGVPPAEIFDIVQNANMSKVWEDGKVHYNNDGKVIKPASWIDPHSKIVEAIDKLKF